MKTILSLLIIFNFNFVFAGPEDESCYYNHSNTSIKEISYKVCIGSGQINIKQKNIQIYSYFSESNIYLKDSVLTHLEINSGDNMIFESIKTIYSKNSANCEESIQLQVKVQGHADRHGTIDVGSLNLTITHSYWADSCHSKPVITQVSFQ